MYQWIDVKTREKIKLLNKKDNVSEILLEHIDPETLQVEYGGSHILKSPLCSAFIEHSTCTRHLTFQNFFQARARAPTPFPQAKILKSPVYSDFIKVQCIVILYSRYPRALTVEILFYFI